MFAELYKSTQFEKDYWFTGQLFIPDWEPPRTEYDWERSNTQPHEPPWQLRAGPKSTPENPNLPFMRQSSNFQFLHVFSSKDIQFGESDIPMFSWGVSWSSPWIRPEAKVIIGGQRPTRSLSSVKSNHVHLVFPPSSFETDSFPAISWDITFISPWNYVA